MKKVLFLMLVAAAVPFALRAETWMGASLMDSACASKAETKASPDAHTTKCAVQCQKSGYGIITKDGTFLKFDAAGNTKVEAALKSTKKTDHLRVDVDGELKGNEIAVKTVSLD
jgi:hypothetical protein